ncbi:hypothetical protein JOF53_000951 [Crossiella equi]|uniref:Uncharacterized protein n=1 Tax=Crossiella equi TaxID=130796 RepID=A0ABS5A661_9PSEU|nr:hypothetical protein [Crossiella equi]MBP2472079.1 hypothetical protein [Crossiella equi]
MPVVEFFSAQQRKLLDRAARRAPDLGSPQPCVVELHGRRVLFYEQMHPAVPGDPTARTRLLACGSALANVVVALRAMGWRSTVCFPVRSRQPDLLAVVTAARVEPPSAADHARYAAITRVRRHTAHLPLSGEPLTGVQAQPLLVAAREIRVRAHWLCPVAALAVADALAGAAHTPKQVRGLTGGMLVVTGGDERADVVRAGAALQRVRLAAAEGGLAAGPLVAPFHDPGLRGELARRFGLGGVPQLAVGVRARAVSGVPVVAPLEGAEASGERPRPKPE